MTKAKTLRDPLCLEAQEEALHHGVVPAVAFAAHAADQAMARQQCLVQRAGVLAAPIRMNNQARRGLSLRDGQWQCCAHQFGMHGRRHRPAHDLAGGQVQHLSEVQPAAARADIRDVAHPGLVGAARVEAPRQQVA